MPNSSIVAKSESTPDRTTKHDASAHSSSSTAQKNSNGANAATATRAATPADSEAETEILPSQNNTPWKGDREKIIKVENEPSSPSAKKTENGSELPQSPRTSESGAGRRKRKLGLSESWLGNSGSNSHSNGAHSKHNLGDKKGSPMKKARLSPGAESGSDDHEQSSSRVASERIHRIKQSKRRSAGEAHDEPPGSSRSAKFSIPARWDLDPQRAATHEPRARSQSPLKSAHKRSSSFHTHQTEQRRLRNRRGSNEGGSNLHHTASMDSAGAGVHHMSNDMAGRTDVDDSGRTPLARACAEGRFPEAKQILDASKRDLDQDDHAGNAPLQLAALNGYTDIVRLLLESGCDVDCANWEGDTPLIDAAENGQKGVVKLLLEYDVDPRRKNFEGDWAKDKLDDDEDSAAIEAMLDAAVAARVASGVDDDTTFADSWSSKDVERRREAFYESSDKQLHYITPNIKKLREFCKNGRWSGALWVLDAGIKPDNMCMVTAARQGHSAMLNMLMGYNADPDPDPAKVNNETPILAAIGRGNLEILQSLVGRAEFDPTRRVLGGKTYYEVAIQRKGPAWKKEAEALRKAARAKGDKSIPASPDFETDTQAQSGPQQHRRKRLVSGKERAEEEQHRAEQARRKDFDQNDDGDGGDDTGDDVEKSNVKSATKSMSKKEEENSDDKGEKERREREAAEMAEAAAAEAAAAAAVEMQARLDAEAQAQIEARKKEEQEKHDAEVAAIKRRAQQEEEQRELAEKRKQEEEARALEEARKREEEEETLRIKAAEEESARQAELQRERERKEFEKEQARLQAEHERRAVEEARIQAERDRQTYLASLPRAIAAGLTPETRYKRSKPSLRAEHRHIRTLRDWLPLILIRRDEIDHGCDSALAEDLYLPNFQAAVLLEHDRLDALAVKHNLKTLPLTQKQRSALWISCPLSRQIGFEHNWDVCADSDLILRAMPHQENPTVLLDWTVSNRDALEKLLNLPDSQSFWVRASDFLALTAPERAPHLLDFEMHADENYHADWNRGEDGHWERPVGARPDEQHLQSLKYVNGKISTQSKRNSVLNGI